MAYLYTVLGITTWVVAVAFSSNALISHENAIQKEIVKKKIEQTISSIETLPTKTIQQPVSLEVVQGGVDTSRPKKIVATTQQKSEAQSVSNNTQVVSKKKVITPIRSNEEEEEDDDD